MLLTLIGQCQRKQIERNISFDGFWTCSVLPDHWRFMYMYVLLLIRYCDTFTAHTAYCVDLYESNVTLLYCLDNKAHIHVVCLPQKCRARVFAFYGLVSSLQWLR